MGLFNKKELIKYELEIHGMKCSMCEAHVNDVIRKNFKVKKVKSSHKNNETIILCEEEIDTDLLQKVISETGYELKNVNKL